VGDPIERNGRALRARGGKVPCLVNAIDRFACLEARLSQHFLGLFQREFRVIPHDNCQQLGSHLGKAERLRRPEFIVFAVRLHGREARTTRRLMPRSQAWLTNPAYLVAAPAATRWPTDPDKCKNLWANAFGSVSVPFDLLYKIDDSTPQLSVANPHERFG